MVPVQLSNDYYLGACFSDDPRYGGDYVVPRSTLKRWEAAKAAYEAMQAEIDQVMDEQRERIRAINAQRPKTYLQKTIEDIYAKPMAFALNIPSLLRGPNYREPE